MSYSFTKIPGKLCGKSARTPGPKCNSISVQGFSPVKVKSRGKTTPRSFKDIPQEKIAAIVDLLK